MNNEYGTYSRDTDNGAYTVVNGKRVPLHRELNAVAVKYAPGFDRDSSTPQTVSRIIGSDPKEETFLPEYGLKVFSIGGPATERFRNIRSADEQLEELNASTDIEYATPVFRHSATSHLPLYVSNRILLKFKSGVSQEAQAELHASLGGRVIETLGYTDNGFLIELWGAAAAHVIGVANAYAQSPLVEWSNPDFIKCISRRVTSEKAIKGKTSKSKKKSTGGREKKSTPANNSLQSRGVVEQWHLDRVDIARAWAITRGSAEVKVAITDDGVDIGHSEFSTRVTDQFDFANRVEDASPKLAEDRHGTPVASVAVAAGIKAKGVAPHCSLMAVRTSGFLGSHDEADMFRWCTDRGASVINCSWGPPDNEGAFPLSDATRAAIDYCVTRGRNGLGTPVVFAAGNGNESVSNDGYASNPQVIAVAACNSEDQRSSYSDRGPEIFITAPSNGGSRSIFTADRRGSAGYNPSRGGPASAPDYFDSFGGTSSAAPLVAGVIGLMISANPQLDEASIRQIIRATADQITGGANDFYDRSGHSDSFGYGRINAGKAVEEAARRAGGVMSGNTNEASINSVASLAMTDAAPDFIVNLGGRSLYSVEVATDSALFNFNTHAEQRNSSNFYGSWELRLETQSPYTLPSDVWNRLDLSGGRLFYRAHVADDLQWANHSTTTSDNNAQLAPSIVITSAGAHQGATPADQPMGSEPSISAAADVLSSAAAPTLTINKGGRRLYAVELAADPELFNASTQGGDRQGSNFYASWQESMLEQVPFSIPPGVWDRFRKLDRIWYRAHFADDENWLNYAVTTSDSNAAHAPSFQIVQESASTGGGSQTSVSELIYPSGAQLDVVPDSNATDYQDPGNHGVPLVAITGNRSTRISANFIVSEFVARGDRYARLSPDLVDAVQSIRSALGKSVKIELGYTRATTNHDHASGLQAIISSGHASTSQLRDLAMSVVRGTVDISEANNGLLLDLSSSSSRDVSTSNNRNITESARRPSCQVSITGPAALGVDEVPGFHLQVTRAATVWIELASSMNAMQTLRDTAEGYYRMHKVWLIDHGVYQVNEADWRLLSRSPYLHYRASIKGMRVGSWQTIKLPAASARQDLSRYLQFDMSMADKDDMLAMRVV